MLARRCYQFQLLNFLLCVICQCISLCFARVNAFNDTFAPWYADVVQLNASFVLIFWGIIRKYNSTTIHVYVVAKRIALLCFLLGRVFVVTLTPCTTKILQYLLQDFKSVYCHFVDTRYYRVNLKPLLKIELKILSYMFVYWTYESTHCNPSQPKLWHRTSWMLSGL